MSAAKKEGQKDEAEQERNRREYEVIRDAFVRMIFEAENGAESVTLLEDVITLRASFLIDRALEGLRIDFDRAVEIIREYNNFTSDRERQQRDVLVAAIENLVDFAVAEEYAMMLELPEELDKTAVGEYEVLCERYNLIYAAEENSTVSFAARTAAWWLTVDSGAVITFMTQGDERVRPWHATLEGISYPKNIFPSELIPPIEWGCRCFLVADGFGSIYNILEEGKPIPKTNPVFQESLATGGAIFSNAHSYFQNRVPSSILEIGKNIKLKFGIQCKK